jgi:hypothetical protein
MRALRLGPLGVAIVAVLLTANTASAATVQPQQPGLPAGCSSLAAGGVHRAGLVVTFGPNDTRSFCIEFTEDAISGIELLERSGLEFVSAAKGGLGDAICQIDGTGCSDPGDCFCRCRGGTCEYWSYYKREGNAWRYLNIGPSTRMLRDGDVDGWAWGRGSVTGGAQPGAPGAGLCPEDTPTPRPAPTATMARPQATQGRPGGGASQPRTAPAGAAPGAPDAPTSTPQPADSATSARGSPTPTSAASSSVAGRSVDRATPAASSTAADDDDGGTSALPLVLFAAVGAGLLGATGYVWYRRSRAHG